MKKKEIISRSSKNIFFPVYSNFELKVRKLLFQTIRVHIISKLNLLN